MQIFVARAKKRFDVRTYFNTLLHSGSSSTEFSAPSGAVAQLPVFLDSNVKSSYDP
jgi:hypothetical protein